MEKASARMLDVLGLFIVEEKFLALSNFSIRRGVQWLGAARC
jgi:hypothetical protein